MNLFQASRQWAVRPDDERFWTLQDLLTQTQAYRKTAIEKTDIPYSTLRVEAIDQSEVALIGKGNLPAQLTHWSFGALARRISAPADYLRDLPATLAAQNLNYGLKKLGEGLGKANLLFHKNGSLLLRDISSDRYERFWNYEIAERLLDSERYGWRTPPARPSNSGRVRAATQADVLEITGGGGLSVRVGDLIGPAGIYASDHDLWVLLINQNNRVMDGSEGGLSRGIFVKNSEVSGASRFVVSKFLFRHICSNHIIWDAKDFQEIGFRHVGHETLDGRIRQALQMAVVTYANDSASDQEAKIQSAKSKILGKTKEEVLDFLFGKRLMGLKAATTAYDSIIPEVDGDPKSVWGLVQGATRVSQATPFMDERKEMEKAAGRVLALA